MASDKARLIGNLKDGLGALVWWGLSGTDITPADMRLILQAEGMDPGIVPDIDSTAAIKAAARSWSRGRGNQERYRSDVLSNGGAAVTVAIQRRAVTGARVDWLQVDSVTWDGQRWTDPGTLAESSDFRQQADHKRLHLDHDWIRPGLIQAELARMSACSLRDQGGVYYVPVQYMKELDRLQRVVGRIGSSALHIAHISPTEAGRRAIQASAAQSVESVLGELVSQLDGWADRSARIPERDAAGVLLEFKALKDRAGLYATALEVSLDDLQAAIKEAEDRARELIDGDGFSRKTRSKPSPVLRERLERLRAECGDVVPFDRLEAAGFPRSAWVHAGYWTSNLAATLADMGLSATFDREGRRVVLSSAIVGAAAPSPAGAPEQPTEEPPAPEADPLEGLSPEARQRLGKMSDQQLRQTYEALAGEPAPLIDLLYSRERLLADVARLVRENQE